MAVSGSVDFKLNRNQLIDEAMAIIGVNSEGENPTAFEIARANSSLNMMIKAWQADGLQLWTRKTGTVFLEKDKVSYTLGPNGSYATKDTPVITQLTADVATSDTTMPVDSTTGMTALDKALVVLDDSTIHLDTVASVTDGTNFELTTGVASAASDNAYVYTFTNLIDRPLRILHSNNRNTSGIDIPMIKISQDEYQDLPNKTSTASGISTQYYYDPQLDDGVLYPWPVMGSDNYILKIVYLKPFDDMDASTDDFEFPQEWLEAITYGLAARLCPIFGVPSPIWDRIRGIARQMKEDVMGFDVENASMFIQPDSRYQ